MTSSSPSEATVNTLQLSDGSNDKEAGGLSTGAKAGIGVGAAVGAISLVCLCIFIAKALI